MRYLSVCSGIEAATVAWHPLGWEPVAFAEIDPFACAVLRHHYPEVPNVGDIAGVDDVGPIDLLVGGTPCQSFSVAGLRAGLADPRGNLVLEYLRVLDRARPRWCVWENVPGVLSVDAGRAFGAVLGGLAELGYGFAYRVLDAQYVGVPQRRRRVFVVGHLGDWRRAAAVLFERASLSGHPAPRRETRQDVAPCLRGGAPSESSHRKLNGSDEMPLLAVAGGQPARYGKGADSDVTDTLIAHSLRADGFDAGEDGTGRGTPLVACPDPLQVLSFDSTWSGDYGVHQDEVGSLRDGNGSVPAVAYSLADGRGRENLDRALEDQVAALHCAKGPSEQQIVAYQCQGNNVGEAGTLRGGNGGLTGGVPFLAFSSKDSGADAGETAPTLRAMNHDASHANAGGQFAVAFHEDQRTGAVYENDHTHALAAQGGGKPGQGYQAVRTGMAVRRLTPRECERLQGFPDSYTAIPYRGKAAADGPRYRALGNSMAVPVMAWIGRRIRMVEEVTA